MFKLRDGCVLTGLCHTHGGSWNLSEIHLDRYIANMWGSFVAGGSAFTRSSRNIRLEFQDEMGVLMLRVELGDGKGNWNTSQLDLTGYIIVKDGCFVFEKRRVPEAMCIFVPLLLTQKPISKGPAEE